MRLPGIKTAKKFSRWLQARLLGGALILGYHRIGAVEHDFYEVSVSSENFAEQMQCLREYVHPISLSKLVQGLKQNVLPPKSVAVTFDDGYTDTLYVAKPMLEKYEIPATVFVCTGYMGKEFWWDELERLINCSRSELHTLHLKAGGKQFEWHATALRSELRKQFGRDLYQFLLSLDVDDQEYAMGLIRSWAKVPASEAYPARAMSGEELLRLVDGGLIELGAHTRYHPVLPQLSVERQKEEIQSSKQELEMLLGKNIAGFSYPNGRANMDSKRLVREIGFNYACTSMHDVVRPGSDLYELTRFWQQDMDGEGFMRGLSRWMRMKVD